MFKKIGNFIFKLAVGIIFLVLITYVNACIFIEFVIPTVNVFDAYDVVLFYVSVGKWIITNIKSLNLEDSYTIISNEPPVSYLVLKYFGTIFVCYSIPLILLWRRWDNIKTHDFFKLKEKVFGDAKWASEDDVIKAGLRSKSGMLVGQNDGGLFVAPGYQHALLFAPTGSGKGVGVVIPNLLFWKESVVIHDIKGENYELTSGWRESIGQKCYVWNPAEPDGITHCYNPLDWISTKPGQMVDDVQKLASLILPKQEFWENEARSLFLGVVLYLLADPTKIKSFGEVVRTLRSDDVVYKLSVGLDILGKQMHPVGYMNLSAFLQKPDKERGSVISTLNSAVELWSNPLIDTATASSDFNFQVFKKVPTTVYVCLTPDNLKRLMPLMQIFYQQSTEFLSRKMPGKDEPYGVMYLLDEFPTLGKMDSFMNGLAFFRGYHVRLYLIIQDTQQLKAIYEESGMNSFLSNCTYRITYAANNVDTANLISQMCGNKTVKQESYSKPKLLDLGQKSVNVSEAQRALLLPQEVISLPRDEQIILIESYSPIKCKKIIYYSDKLFTARLLKKTAVPTQVPYSSIAKETQEQEATS